MLKHERDTAKLIKTQSVLHLLIITQVVTLRRWHPLDLFALCHTPAAHHEQSRSTLKMSWLLHSAPTRAPSLTTSRSISSASPLRLAEMRRRRIL